MAFANTKLRIASFPGDGIGREIIPPALVLVDMLSKRLGFDPATASSIFLTTATDVISMGMLLGLATILVP